MLSQLDIFNTIWLIGLFFFGIQLLLLEKIIGKPRVIAIFPALAGFMYMVDISAHFLLSNYEAYQSIFLALVVIPSIVGEMSLAVWLLVKKEVNDDFKIQKMLCIWLNIQYAKPYWTRTNDH